MISGYLLCQFSSFHVKSTLGVVFSRIPTAVSCNYFEFSRYVHTLRESRKILIYIVHFCAYVLYLCPFLTRQKGINRGVCPVLDNELSRVAHFSQGETLQKKTAPYTYKYFQRPDQSIATVSKCIGT